MTNDSSRPVSQRLLRVARTLVPITFGVLIAAVVWAEREKLESLSDAPATDLLLIGALVMSAHFLNSTEFWVFFRVQGAPIGLLENWMVFLAGHLANHLPAQAGALYRLQYMSVVHDVPYSKSVAVFGANLFATLGGASVAGLVGTLMLGVNGSLSVTMIGVYAAMAIAAGGLLLVPVPNVIKGGGRLAKGWRAFREGFDQVRSSGRSAVAVVLLEAAKYVATAWRFQIAFGLLGENQPFWFFLALAPAAGIARYLAFTPGAIGIREGFIAAAAVALGSPLTTGILAATVDRAVMFATSIVLGSIGFAASYPRLRRARSAVTTPCDDVDELLASTS